MGLDLICQLHKKGNQLEYDSYRGIAFMNTAYEILSNIFYKILKLYTEACLGKD